MWWPLQASNPGRADLQSAALPTELRSRIRSLGQSTSRRASTLNASSTSGIPSRLTLISLCPTSIFRRCDIGLTYERDSLGCPQGLPTYKTKPLQFTIPYALMFW